MSLCTPILVRPMQAGGLEVVVRNKTMIFPHTDIQLFEQGVEAYNEGALIQHAFWFLNTDEREFIQSGTTPEEWAEMMRREADMEDSYSDESPY